MRIPKHRRLTDPTHISRKSKKTIGYWVRVIWASAPRRTNEERLNQLCNLAGGVYDCAMRDTADGRRNVHREMLRRYGSVRAREKAAVRMERERKRMLAGETKAEHEQRVRAV